MKTLEKKMTIPIHLSIDVDVTSAMHSIDLLTKALQTLVAAQTKDIQEPKDTANEMLSDQHPKAMSSMQGQQAVHWIDPARRETAFLPDVCGRCEAYVFCHGSCGLLQKRLLAEDAPPADCPLQYFKPIGNESGG